MNILLTGGAGYIGSHTIIELDKAGHSVVVVDNFMNSQPESLRLLLRSLVRRFLSWRLMFVIVRLWRRCLPIIRLMLLSISLV